MRQSRIALPASLPVAILLLCILISRPWGEIGYNDDWSYIWSARVLAQTGHITYNGWAAFPLGWQLYLGALFVKLFGFSFQAVRASVLLVALLSSWLLQRIFVRCGIGEWNASFATLVVTLCPVYLTLAFSFMSDVPAFFCSLLCFYGCLRAIQAADDRAALGWLCAASLLTDLGGTVRQTVALSTLIMVPCAAWIMRKRRGALVTGAALWVVALLSLAVTLHFYRLQPYTFSEPLRTGVPIPIGKDIRTLLTTAFWALPVLAAFLVNYHRQRISWQKAALACAGVIALTTACGISRKGADWLAPFSRDAVPPAGIDLPTTVLGNRPTVFPVVVSYTLTALFVAAVFATLIVVLRKVQDRPNESRYHISDRSLFILLAPMNAAYLLLICTRITPFDRYGIPLLVVLIIVLLRLYERKIAAPLPAWSMIALAAMAAFSVASLHDFWATSRARILAAQQLLHAGVPKNQISAGLDFDGWTQLELAGFISTPKLNLPQAKLAVPCLSWYLPNLPQLHPAYALSYERMACLPDSHFPPVEFKTWLGPHDREIYILAVPH